MLSLNLLLFYSDIDISRIAESTLLINQKKEHMNQTEYQAMDNLKDLEQKDISTVMMVWCHQSTFEFSHVLSVLSVIFFLNPDYITFHYNVFPMSNKDNHWIQFLMVRYPYFRYEHSPHLCASGRFITSHLRNMSADIYVDFDIILGKSLQSLKWNKDNEIAPVFVTHKGNLLLYRKTKYIGYKMKLNCLTLYTSTSRSYQESPCYIISTIKPSDIWNCKHAFCEIARLVMYYQVEEIKPVRHENPVIPNIVHYVMFGKNYVDFAWYVSILSFIHIGNVSKVFIHCDNNPHGEYWKKLIQNERHRKILVVVHRENPTVVFNQNLVTYVEHVVDTVKLDILHDYGGIIVDNDLILIKPFDSEWFHYDFVMGRDICQRKYYCLELLNMGMILSKPKSLFSQIYIDSMRTYDDEDWLWNAGILSSKMMELNPNLVFVSLDLQLICLQLHCIMYDSLTEEGADLKYMQKHTYSLHFTDVAPFTSEEDLSSKTGYIGELGRYVLSKAARILQEN